MNSPLGVVTLEGRVVGLVLRIYALAISGYLTATIAAYLFMGANRDNQAAYLASRRVARAPARHAE